jgi:hypothetical protein
MTVLIITMSLPYEVKCEDTKERLSHVYLYRLWLSCHLKINIQRVVQFLTYIAAVHVDKLLIRILFLDCYSVWMWEMLQTFRRYLRPPDYHYKLTKQTELCGLIRKRTIPTERPLLVSEASANFCG